MKPTIGRIVHYHLTDVEAGRAGNGGAVLGFGFILPAIVVAVHSETCVNLKVFTDSAVVDISKMSVGQGEGPGQWSWPKREE